MKAAAGPLLLTLAIGTVVRLGAWIALAAAAAAVVVTLWRFAGWLDRQLERREARRAAEHAALANIAWRADEQNALVIARDARGIYGDYPPNSLFRVNRKKAGEEAFARPGEKVRAPATVAAVPGHGRTVEGVRRNEYDNRNECALQHPLARRRGHG